MTSIDFADAVRPDTVRILRLLMQPYSIGHELILLKERNPLIVLNEVAFDLLPIPQQITAVIRAVLVCCQDYESSSQPHKWLKLWGWRNRHSNYIDAAWLFRRYRADGSTFPPSPDKESDEIANGKDEGGRQLGGDIITRVLNFLCTKYRAFGYSSVYNFPFGMALHLYTCELEVEGRIRIENDRERQVKSEMKEHLEAIAKERKAAAAVAKGDLSQP